VQSTVYRVVAALCAALLMLSVLTMLGLQKFVIKPLRKLDEGTDVIGRTGKLDFRLDIQTEDEIGHLAHSFNDMMETIQRSDAGDGWICRYAANSEVGRRKGEEEVGNRNAEAGIVAEDRGRRTEDRRQKVEHRTQILNKP
jgi:HAMP domain-containing protein